MENKMPTLNENKKKLITSCHAIFSSAEGQVALEQLKYSYLMQPVADPNKSEAHAYVREGENNLIRFFMQLPELKSQLVKLSQPEKQ